MSSLIIIDPVVHAMTTRCFAEPALDFAIQPAELPGQLTQVWAIAGKLDWRFYRWGQTVIVKSPHGLGIVGAGSPDFDAWIEIEHPALFASERAPLVTAPGAVYRWNLPGGLERVLDLSAASAHELADGGFLVTHIAQPSGLDVSAVDARGQVRWRRPQLYADYVTRDYIVSWVGGFEAVERIDPISGATMWTWAAPGAETVLAIGEVDRRLWFGWRPWRGPCRLLAVDLDTGAVVAELAIDAIGVPRLEDDGVAGWCGDRTYVRIDLRRAMEVERRGWTTATVAHGQHMRTSDGRVVFHDRQGDIWALGASEDSPALLWRTERPIVTLAPANGGLLIQDSTGDLTFLGR